MKKLLCLSILILTAFSCTSNMFDSKTEMLAFLGAEENGFKQSKSINGVDFTLMYRPTDLMVHQDWKQSKDLTIIPELRKKYEDYIYINLSISRNKKDILSTHIGGKNEYGQMVNTMSFSVGNSIHLIGQQSKDTLSTEDFISPRLYGLNKASSVLLIYPRTNLIDREEELVLSIEDFGLNTGNVKFKIPSSIIKDQPTLSF